MKNILLMTITLLFSLNLNGQVNSCYGDEKAGMKALGPGEKERAILYFIKHEFKLETDAAFTPLIYAVSFNHAWVDEPFVPCLDFDVNPKDQQPGFEPFAMDTIIDDVLGLLGILELAWEVAEDEVEHLGAIAVAGRKHAALNPNAVYRDPMTGRQVFTAEFLAERGTCCESGCRHLKISTAVKQK